MSGAGTNYLAAFDPESYAAQIAIQRRQALAQSLLEQGGSNPGNAAYGGLRNAGNAILGAFLAKRADKQLADFYNPQTQTGGVDPGQLSNSSGSGPIMSQPDQASMTDTFARRYNMTPQEVLGSNWASQASQPPTSQQSGQGFSPGDNPPDYALLPKHAQQVYDKLPHLPGATATETLQALYSGQAGWNTFLKAHYDAMAQTPEMKNAAFVNPGDANAQRTALGGILTKSGTVTGRAGNVLIGPDGRTNYVPPQAPPGYRYIQGQDGQPYLVQIGGGMSALANSAYAQQAPKALLTPQTQYGPDNLPVNSNQLAASGNAGAADQLGIGPQQPMGIRTNNPGNIQPGGQQANYGSPAEGILRASQNLDAYAAQGINTLGGIISRWAPPGPQNDTQAYIADASKRLGVDPNQPLNLKDPRVKGAVLDAIFTHEQGAGRVPAPQPLRPELPQGQSTYMQGQAKDAADRHDGTVAAAAESPMRINVLDNIINLSKQGVATGPGQEWQNTIKGYVANTPGIKSLLPKGVTADLANFQMLQKYTYQNAIRSWQAAGGTGTDAQMESMAHANPNDKLFPQALQHIAEWGKAAEMAVQAKANAQDAFLAQNGQTPQAQIKFENSWRNAFEPKVFQYQIMSPLERQQFAAHDLRTPQAAQAFIAKQQQLRAIGALQ